MAKKKLKNIKQMDSNSLIPNLVQTVSYLENVLSGLTPLLQNHVVSQSIK